MGPASATSTKKHRMVLNLPRRKDVEQAVSLLPHSSPIVGQIILAAAGFQPALAEPEDSRMGLKKPPQRRLGQDCPAPQFMQQTQKGKNYWH
jgi:hypothetical protein